MSCRIFRVRHLTVLTGMISDAGPRLHRDHRVTTPKSDTTVIAEP